MQTTSHIESQIEFTQEQCRWCHQRNPNVVGTQWCDPECQPSGLLAGRYVQHIDDLVESYHNPVLIMYDDLQVLHDDEECLKRIYSLEEYSNKIGMLSEYYKFHNEVPRLFMLSIAETLDNYIDERRQLEYVKVTNILKKDQPQQKRKASKYQPVQKLLESIDLSYEDFEKRDKKKEPKNKKTKIVKACGPAQKNGRLHIQSIEQRARFQHGSGSSAYGQLPSKQSSKKKHQPVPILTQNDNTKSCKALSRQKSRGTLQTIYRAHQQSNGTHKVEEPVHAGGETHRGAHPEKKLSTHSIKRSTSKPKLTIYRNPPSKEQPAKQQPAELARMRCNSRPMLKASAVPLKTIDMNKLGGSGRLNLQPSKTSLHNISKIQRKPQPPQDKNSTRKTSIQSRDNSKNSKKAVGFSSASSTQHLQQSQHSNGSNPPNKRNLENMFSSVLAMKKHRTLGLGPSQQQSS